MGCLGGLLDGLLSGLMSGLSARMKVVYGGFSRRFQGLSVFGSNEK